MYTFEKGRSGPPSKLELLAKTGLRMASITRQVGQDGWQSCVSTWLISFSVRPMLVSLRMSCTSLVREICPMRACSSAAAFLTHKRRRSTRSCSSLTSLASTSTLIGGFPRGCGHENWCGTWNFRRGVCQGPISVRASPINLGRTILARLDLIWAISSSNLNGEFVVQGNLTAVGKA